MKPGDTTEPPDGGALQSVSRKRPLRNVSTNARQHLNTRLRMIHLHQVRK